MRRPRKPSMFRVPKNLFDALASALFGPALPAISMKDFKSSKHARTTGSGRKSTAFHVDGNTSPRKLCRYMTRQVAEGKLSSR
jgi:hypothetical protein